MADDKERELAIRRKMEELRHDMHDNPFANDPDVMPGVFGISIADNEPITIEAARRIQGRVSLILYIENVTRL
jgi:hypothetical protein